VNVRVPLRTPKQEAEEVARGNYEHLKDEILRAVAGRLRSQGITTMIHQDLEVAYNEGWQGVTQHIIQGRPVTSLDGLLYRMTHRRAIDIYRARQERRRVDIDLEQHGIEVDLAEQVDDQEKLTRLLGRLQERLNDKERRAVTLCVLHGYKRPEAADLLGIERVVFERIMDGATKKMSGIVASIEARGCGGDEWSRLMRAFALGLLSEEETDYRRALEHVEGPRACEACGRYIRGLRGLAAVLPPLLPAGGHETGVLAYLYRVFGGGHAATGGSSIALQGSTATGTAVAGPTTAGGLSSLLGGGAVKAATTVGAGIAAAGSIALPTTSRDHSLGRTRHRAQLSVNRASSMSPGGVGSSVNYVQQAAGNGHVKTRAPRLPAVPARRVSVIAAEFGFETSQRSSSQVAAHVPSGRPPIAMAAVHSSIRQQHTRSSAQFEFEQASVGSVAGPHEKETSAEFGFERHGRP
jgi:RNA polymerase sigma factor (sigma-70 family)